MELRNGSRFYKNANKVFVSKIVQKCVCEMCLKMASVFCKFDQVTKSYLPYFTQRYFLCF